MNGKTVTLTIQGEKKEYPAGTSFLRIAQDYSDAYQDDIVWYCTISGCGS